MAFEVNRFVFCCEFGCTCAYSSRDRATSFTTPKANNAMKVPIATSATLSGLISFSIKSVSFMFELKVRVLEVGLRSPGKRTDLRADLDRRDVPVGPRPR